jgi:hypothetical protein
MVKRIALFIAAFMVSAATFAQFEQGKVYCGASLSGFDLSYSGLQKARLNVQGKVGYFFADNLMATAEGALEKQQEVPHTASLGLGARYYIIQNGVYLGASALYKHRKGYDDFLPSIQVGYSYFVSRTVTIEPEIYYEQSFKDHKDYSTVGLRIGVGVYLFSDQKKN